MEQAGSMNFDLGSILSLSTVQVVQSIDVEGLQKTLKWICAKLAQQEEGGKAATAGTLENMVQQNSMLRDEIKNLKEHQSNLVQHLDSKADRDQLPGQDVLLIPEQLADLQARMNALEGGATAGSDVSSRLDAVEKALEELQHRMHNSTHNSGRMREQSVRVQADAPLQGTSSENMETLQQTLSNLEQRLDTKAEQSSFEELRAHQEQLQQLQPQGSGTGADDLAALSARMRELEEDRAVGLEALEAAVASLKDAMSSKADAERVQSIWDKVSELSLAKADQSGLDELRIRLAMTSSQTSSAPDGAVGSDALVQVIQGMLEEKADKAEVAQLKEVLNTKAGTEQLEELRTQFIMDGAPAVAAVGSTGDVGAQGTLALKDDLSRLADQVGDMYGEIEKLREQIPRAGLVVLPRQASHKVVEMPSMPTQQPEPGSSNQPESRLLPVAVQDASTMHVLQELQVLKDQVEMVAHATNILAVGLEARGMAGGGGGAANSGSPAPTAAVAPSSGKENRQPRGAYARLVKLLGSQGIDQKMDHFDPEVLNRMSQKLAYVDALLKNPSFARGGGVEDLGIRELEAQMRKMGRDIRAVKQAQALGVVPQGEGEHAMLAGKPILGYRCMACDRPIEKLDDRAGPHVPSNQMTTKVMLGKPDISKTVLKSPTDTPPQTRKKAAYDPSLRGPQTWYEDQRNIAADGLPPSDVGPKLAPGGWRSSASGAAPMGRPNNLPDLPITAGRPTSPQMDLPAKSSNGKSGPIYDLPVLPRIS